MSDLAFEGRGTSGTPLILIHGFPVHRGMWRQQLAALGGMARVVAVDLPGFGGSPAPATGILTMDGLADAVLGLADALGFERFIAAGLSMGGYVSLSLARRHPQRLSGLVLMDTRAEADSPEAQQNRHADADRVLAEGTGFFLARQRPMWLSPATLAGRPELVREVDAMALAASARSVAAALRGLAARRDERAILRDLDLPTLVLCGQDDKITPPAGMHALAEAIPGARFSRVPGGHLPPVEHPDEVNAELAAFLSRP